MKKKGSAMIPVRCEKNRRRDPENERDERASGDPEQDDRDPGSCLEEDDPENEKQSWSGALRKTI